MGKHNCALKVLLFVIVAGMVLAPAMSAAGTRTGSLAVSATVLDGCTVFTVPALAFGSSIEPGAVNVHPATAPTISANCGIGTTAYITMNAGLNGSGGTPATVRNLKDGSYLLPYHIDTTAFGGTHEWGDTAYADTFTGTDVSVTGTYSLTTLPVFPWISSVPLSQAAGAYTDTVTATINFG
jgi:spore coat protein U-like protein